MTDQHAEYVAGLEDALRTVIAETELHTWGKPGYDLTLDHLHDVAWGALNDG